jgi:hypothetical protein
MDDFGRYLGCMLYGLLWTVVILFVTVAVLGALILAGDL